MMKYLTIILILSLTVLGCKKESTPKTTLNEQVDPKKGVEQGKGNFISGPYGSVAGNARIYKVGETFQLALEAFSTTNGPDLKVYLSKQLEPSGFVNLGSLKAINGNLVYTLPNEVNYKDYSYVLIYCQQFKHLFGSAKLDF